MIEDMTARKFGPASQRSHIESCERFAAYLKRSPARVATGMISGVVSPLDELRKLPKSPAQNPGKRPGRRGRGEPSA